MNSKLLPFLLIATILLSGTVVAQQDTTNQKREVYTIEGKESRSNSDFRYIYQSKFADWSGKSNKRNKRNNEQKRANPFGINKGHWAGITLSYNGLISDLGDFSLPSDAEFLSQTPKSIGISINPIDFYVPFNKHFGFVTGLGFEFNNFRFSQNMTPINLDGVIVPDLQYDNNGIDLSKSKLSTYYMNIPVLLEYRTGGRNEFFVNAGVIGGWRMGAHTKIKARDPQLKGKFKDHGDLGLRNFHYGYTLNIGFENVALSATYYPQSIFRKSYSPKVEQINIGISILM